MSEHDFERGVAVLREQIDARISAYFSSCVHCGLCAEACLFYTETGNARYTPIHKLQPLRRLWEQEYTFWGRLGRRLGLYRELTEQDFADWETLVYDSCTLCGRCSMVCPVGNDIAHMIRREREAFSAAGYAPDGLIEATERALRTGSPMGVTAKTLLASIKNVEKEIGMPVPVDQVGAEYMSLLSSMEIVNFPEYIGSLTRIFSAAGVSWTISTDAYEATNSGIQIGKSEAAAALVNRIVAAAERLGVNYVISPECGHAFTAIRWEAPNLIGRDLPFQVVHILELLERLYRDGRLRLQGTTETRLTFHDPCQIVRRGGVVEQPRYLLRQVASNFVEMGDSGTMNWCCGGGGGVSANERAEPLRLQAFARKKKQLDAIGPELVVTACANCRIILEEGLEYYEMAQEVIGLTELIAEHLAPSTA
jgi:Fe-S oxidoreductase